MNIMSRALANFSECPNVSFKAAIAPAVTDQSNDSPRVSYKTALQLGSCLHFAPVPNETFISCRTSADAVLHIKIFLIRIIFRYIYS